MSDERKKALQALKTARGQIDGIVKMLEDDRYCIDVSNQIIAAGAQLKRANMIILENHMNHCVKEAFLHESGEEKVKELMQVLDKLIYK
ncbi:metal-sensing transcriptional repressor [Clostridium hydrogeniformans]|uniref:metal-sensing transcriptional repressor n=1 Tax=Clostridium hydrogeniformans TaxID=349933 RepID=UPI0004899C00|nr:metal-sensing transcriptional repressor [Clostridium hydrogeniformans]